MFLPDSNEVKFCLKGINKDKLLVTIKLSTLKRKNNMGKYNVSQYPTTKVNEKKTCLCVYIPPSLTSLINSKHLHFYLLTTKCDKLIKLV